MGVEDIRLGLNHASMAQLDGYGVLITGRSGSGKSSVLVELMALGADLISDDQTLLSQEEDHIVGSAPDALSGLVEMRGIGVVRLRDQALTGRVQLIVDLDTVETERMPLKRSITVGSTEIALILGADRATLGTQLFVLMKNQVDLLRQPNV